MANWTLWLDLLIVNRSKNSIFPDQFTKKHIEKLHHNNQTFKSDESEFFLIWLFEFIINWWAKCKTTGIVTQIQLVFQNFSAEKQIEKISGSNWISVCDFKKSQCTVCPTLRHFEAVNMGIRDLERWQVSSKTDGKNIAEFYFFWKVLLRQKAVNWILVEKTETASFG